MSKIERQHLLNRRLQAAFDGFEIQFLYQLLDEHMCDWPDDRRAKFDPLLADLGHLANVLKSEGGDYGVRKMTKWADDVLVVAEGMTVEVICYCGTRIVIREEADSIAPEERPWVVICPRHEGPSARVLGTVWVKGVPESPLHGKLAVQQFLASQEGSLRDGDSLLARVQF